MRLKRTLFADRFFPYLQDYSHRWELYMGGAGSGKSYFITQKLLIRAAGQKIRILVCRRYASTLRNSCFSLFKEILAKWKLTQYVKVNESDYRITFPNGSEVLFMGLDDEAKLLSINNIGTIFVEEAFEVSRSMVEQLNLRMRAQVKDQQIIMAWNPISKNHWLYNFAEEDPPADCLYVRSTYKDNPFLSEEYVKSLEELRTRNPQRARIFVEGEWGVDSEGLVLQNWEISQFDVMALAQRCEHRAGSDLGYVDPTTVVDTLYDREGKTIYVFNEFYKSGCQLDEVCEAIEKMGLRKTKIYFDAAEPRTIEYFKRRMLNAVPCIKGPNSVEARIRFLQNHRIIVTPNCVHLIAELENFSYIKDKATDQLTDKTTHEWSHAIDALGYAYSDIYSRGRLRTLDKSVLGL